MDKASIFLTDTPLLYQSALFRNTRRRHFWWIAGYTTRENVHRKVKRLKNKKGFMWTAYFRRQEELQNSLLYSLSVHSNQILPLHIFSSWIFFLPNLTSDAVTDEIVFCQSVQKFCCSLLKNLPRDTPCCLFVFSFQNIRGFLLFCRHVFFFLLYFREIFSCSQIYHAPLLGL